MRYIFTIIALLQKKTKKKLKKEKIEKGLSL